MAIPANKEELIYAITIHYEKLKNEVSSIPHHLATVNELEGHSKDTMISINNLLAYLVGWGELVLKWNHRMDNRKPTEFPEKGFKWNELGKLAQKFYEDYKGDDFVTLLSKLDETVKAISRLIEGKSNDQLYGVQWYGKWTLGRMIQLNTSSPYSNARSRIRRWRKRKKV